MSPVSINSHPSKVCSRTLYESKGLEFNDVGPHPAGISKFFNATQVLVYNFFKDSTANVNQWRLVMRGDPDETRHASICMEVWFSIPSATQSLNHKV